jgi:RES domain-containing protein
MATITAWRITKARYASAAFSGEGAKREGGRWNSVGVPVVYMAQSRSLAVLEVLVHLDEDEMLKYYRLISAAFDRRLVKEIVASELPGNWKKNPPPPSTMRIGDKWIASGDSVVLRVPSAIVPHESIFLLNAQHPDFHKVELGRPEPFHFDRRLR